MSELTSVSSYALLVLVAYRWQSQTKHSLVGSGGDARWVVRVRVTKADQGWSGDGLLLSGLVWSVVGLAGSPLGWVPHLARLCAWLQLKADLGEAGAW